MTFLSQTNNKVRLKTKKKPNKKGHRRHNSIKSSSG
jgi:hypothetical protein